MKKSLLLILIIIVSLFSLVFNGFCTDNPKYGGMLKMIRTDSPSVAGGWPAESARQELGAQAVIEPLLHSTHAGGVVPWLATSYTLAEDRRSITFELRQGVKFHDGTDFNAEAAKWNLDWIIASKARPEWDSVDILGDYTIRINLDKWDAAGLRNFADGTYTWMVSPTAYEKNGKDWMMAHPTGTGAFKFESFVRDSGYKLVRNNNYWGKDEQGNQLPYLDAIEIKFVSDEMTYTMAMISGTVDAMQSGANKACAEMQKAGLIVEALVDSTSCFVPDSANADSPYSIQKVREAVEHAIDREALAEAFSYGFCEAANQLPGSDTNLYNPNFTIVREYEPDKAKALLEEAGYKNGFDTTILVMPGRNRELAVALQGYLAEVNIKAELNFPADMGKYIELCNSLHSMLSIQPFPDFGNWAYSMTWVVGPSAQMNKNWERSPEFTEAYNNMMATPFLDLELARAVTNQMSREASFIPILQSALGWVLQDYVKNGDWFNRGVPAWWNPPQVWLDK